MPYLAISIHVLSKIELFVTKVNRFEPLNTAKKSSILDASRLLDPPLLMTCVTSMTHLLVTSSQGKK